MIPDWPEGTVAILTTAGPHAIPVSTALRTGARTVVFALGPSRGSLARLREDPRCALALIAVTIRPPSREHIEAFRDWAGALPELVGVFVVSGGDDFLLHVAVPDTDALYAFVIDRLTERAEVADVRTSVVYEHIRRPVLEPLDQAS